MTNQQNDLTKDAAILGKKIALMLETSSLAPELKQAIIESIPAMSLEEIDDLIKLLGQHIMEGHGDDKALERKLSTLKKTYQGKQDKLTNDTLKELEDIEKQIK